MLRIISIKLLKENIEDKPYVIGFGNGFLHIRPKIYAIKIKI
jgi:hypothetical protein